MRQKHSGAMYTLAQYSRPADENYFLPMYMCMYICTHVQETCQYFHTHLPTSVHYSIGYIVLPPPPDLIFFWSKQKLVGMTLDLCSWPRDCEVIQGIYPSLQSPTPTWLCVLRAGESDSAGGGGPPATYATIYVLTGGRVGGCGCLPGGECVGS